MTTAGVTATTHWQLPARRDERVLLYLEVAGAMVLFGVLGSGLRTIIVAVPFLVAVALGVRRSAPMPVALSISLEADRCVEGDVVRGRIDVNAPAGVAIEIVIERSDPAFEPVERPWAWRVPVGVDRPVGLPVEVAAVRWGRGSAGRIRVRLVDHGSLMHREGFALAVPEITVLPIATRLTRAVRVRRPPAAAGVHPVTALLSGGYDFAEVRDYQPGDRLRDLNWAASMRRDQPATNHRLPERAGDLVIIVDSFPDALKRHSEIARDTVAVVGRLAWSLARAHLRSNDRVGIAVEGSRTAWLAPRSGRRAEYAIFAALLQSTASSADTVRAGFVREHGHVPDGATVIAISPLARPPTLDRIGVLRSRGHPVSVVAVDIGPELASRVPALPHEIRRIRDASFRENVAALRRQAIDVVVADLDDPGGALHALSRDRPRSGGRR